MRNDWMYADFVSESALMIGRIFDHKKGKAVSFPAGSLKRHPDANFDKICVCTPEERAKPFAEINWKKI